MATATMGFSRGLVFGGWLVAILERLAQMTKHTSEGAVDGARGL